MWTVVPSGTSMSLESGLSSPWPAKTVSPSGRPLGRLLGMRRTATVGTASPRSRCWPPRDLIGSKVAVTVSTSAEPGKLYGDLV